MKNLKTILQADAQSGCPRPGDEAGNAAACTAPRSSEQSEIPSTGITVRFVDRVDDALLKFAVIAARSSGNWVFCRHRERETWELPGGRREAGEPILMTAERELREETGALAFSLRPVCVYAVTGKNQVNPNGQETFGMLCFAEIEAFGGSLKHEIAQVVLLRQPPQNWTYPQIQPRLLREVCAREAAGQIQLETKDI